MHLIFSLYGFARRIYPIGIIVMFMMFASGCSMTGFGGMTLQEPHSAAIGGTVGVWLIEGEFEKSLEQEGGRSVDYAINLRLPIKWGDGALRGNIGSLMLTPYIIGGWGAVDGDSSGNAGLGVIFGKDEQKEILPHLMVWPSLRLDYRHFFTPGSDDIDRLYFGLEFLFSMIG